MCKLCLKYEFDIKTSYPSHLQKQGLVIGVGVHMYYRVLLQCPCRIDMYSLDANTKVYGDGLENFKHFFFFPLFFSLSYDEQASDNTKAMMKKQIWQIHSVLSHVGPQPFSFLSHFSLLLEISSRHFQKH